MKKMYLGLATLVLLFTFSGCGVKQSYESYEESNNGASLEHNGINYTFYGALPNDELRGMQIGIVGNDEKHKIYEVKNYSTEEWLIEYYDVTMSVYSLYKADSVTDIPIELQQ